MFILLIIFALLCGFIYIAQNSMLFHHVSDPDGRDYLRSLADYREVEFTAGNGKTYRGMMYQPINEAAPLIIYFGGNGECSYSHMRSRDALGQWDYFAGYNYLFVDYEGYGLNPGKTSYTSIYEGALAAYDYALTLAVVDPERIVAMGFSLGTGSAVYLAAKRSVAGLILAAPYANGYDIYNNALPVFYGPLKLLVRQKLPSDRYAPLVTCPALIIASRRDEVIPFSSSERLAKLIASKSNVDFKVDFVELNYARHNDLISVEGVYEKVQVFLEALYLPPERSRPL